jgi:hypothetical protein
MTDTMTSQNIDLSSCDILYNEGLNKIEAYSSLNIIKMMESRMRWAGHVDRMVRVRNS